MSALKFVKITLNDNTNYPYNNTIKDEQQLIDNYIQRFYKLKKTYNELVKR